MAAYNIYQAKTSLSALVDKAAAGEEVVIARAGKPMVKMVPIVPSPAASTAKPKYYRKAPGFAKGQWNDLLVELDKPWPEDLQRAFGMLD